MTPRRYAALEANRELLVVLTKKVRVLSLEQVAKLWCRGDGQVARRRVKRLEECGLLSSRTLLAHPELELAGPLVCWRPGEPSVDPGSLAHTLESRWHMPLRATQCVIATSAAGRLIGGHGGRAPRTTEASHDLNMSAVYCCLHASDPCAASAWVSEAHLQSLGLREDGVLPDGAIWCGHSLMFVEFGGRYSRDRLATFVAYCESRGTGFEIW